MVRLEAALARQLAQVQAGERLDALVDATAGLQGQQIVALGKDEMERQEGRRPTAG